MRWGSTGRSLLKDSWRSFNRQTQKHRFVGGVSEPERKRKNEKNQDSSITVFQVSVSGQERHFPGGVDKNVGGAREDEENRGPRAYETCMQRSRHVF